MLDFVYASLFGYILGCISPSYLLTRKIKKADIRKMGSGNAGASNTVSALGWKYGIFVAVFDISKGAFAIYILKWIFGDTRELVLLNLLLFTAGLFVILGHNHPFYMRFRGGKGTASLIGVFAAIDIRIGLILGVVIILVTILTDYIALGALSNAVAAVACTALFGYEIGCIAIATVIAILSFVRHIENIKRIGQRKEDGLRKAIKAK